MKYKNFAHIELDLTAKNKNTIGNSANYKNLAQWNGSEQGNITSVGSNGNNSFYGLFDTSGQVYEWTETSLSDVDIDKIRLKNCRGGCYADTTSYGISKENSKYFDLDSMLNEGFFGCRIASISNSHNYDNFVNIANTGNPPDDCDDFQFGSIGYSYQINKYLLTNNEYCSFLNTVDPSGLNIHNIYDTRMSTSPVGGISLIECSGTGNKYNVKNNMSDKPVTFIKWTMAAKYTNWLHNNKSSNIQNIYSGAYNLSNLNTYIDRQNGAKYFLPNENEWYKAAYYDPTIQDYWQYGTKNNTDPLAIISNSLGSGINVEKYYLTTKTFPILIDKINETFSIFSSEEATVFDPTNPCPTVIIEGSKLESSSRNIYKINAEISNLEYGKEYFYEFKSAFANWPTKITPVSGSFTSYSDKQEINAILEFCPKNYKNISICNSNLTYLNINDTTENYLINLELQISSTNACSSIRSSNYTAIFDDLPSIVKQQKYLNIEFLDSHENSIIVSGQLCCQPIPIVVAVSGHNKGEVYNYTLESSSSSIGFVNNSGAVSFGNQIGKITTYATGLGILNNNISVLTAKVFKDNIMSTDQVLLQCISDCEKTCDNYANFNNKAIWGSCEAECSDLPDIPRSSGSVTTIKTNGGSGPYDTYDMDGNVQEIIHAGNIKANPASYNTRGGSFKTTTVGKSVRNEVPSNLEDVGFRVASYSNPYNYIDMVTVGNPFNQNDSTNYGAVPYSFKIDEYPVTNCKYVEFLNSVASTSFGSCSALSISNLVYHSGMSGCYGGIDRIDCNESDFYYQVQDCMDHKPVRFITPHASLRYINWLENNKIANWGSTISGTYILNICNNTAVSGNRLLCSKYFLPSENEWYKAAYFNPVSSGYWNYSTQTNISPDPVSATGCGEGYRRLDCSSPAPKPPCPTPTIVPCTPTATPTPTITPTPTPTPTITPTPSTSYNFIPLFINIVP
jgi:formylglycine-generating enzyme required for sulfatase activity